MQAAICPVPPWTLSAAHCMNARHLKSASFPCALLVTDVRSVSELTSPLQTASVQCTLVCHLEWSSACQWTFHLFLPHAARLRCPTPLDIEGGSDCECPGHLHKASFLGSLPPSDTEVGLDSMGGTFQPPCVFFFYVDTEDSVPQMEIWMCI